MNTFDRKTIANSPARTQRCMERLRGFGSSEDGFMTILTLFLFMTVFMAAGFAVDMMRYDRERTKLQYALDRAVLAAADLDQELCPKDVVKDYLSKEGLDKYLVGEITVTPDLCGAKNARLAGKRKVEAKAKMDIQTHFMRWSGVNTLPSVASSVAEEAIGDVEISLVLDVSGSMRGTKLTQLKEAANKFVDEMVKKTEDGKMSMSIIPYSEQVSVPDFLMNMLNTRGANERVNCVDFSSDDFTKTEFKAYNLYDSDSGTYIPQGGTINQTLHFNDDFSSTGTVDNRSADTLVVGYTCGEEQSKSKRTMTVMQNDADTLKKQIQRLEADGWTSIDVGLKWGLTLLDESVQPLIAQLADDTNIPKVFDDRPFKNKTSDSVKVIVLMTDGENTLQHKINPPYNDGPSVIAWNADQDVYSVYDESRNKYVWLDVPRSHVDGSDVEWFRKKYQNKAYGNNQVKWFQCLEYRSNGSCKKLDTENTKKETVFGESELLDWPDVWAHTEKQAIKDILQSGLGSDYADDFDRDATTVFDKSDKDPRVDRLCTEAADEEIVVFTIAYGAPEGVKPMLKKCAVDDGRFYDTGSDTRKIEQVFDSISATIQNLRLTQ